MVSLFRAAVRAGVVLLATSEPVSADLRLERLTLGVASLVAYLEDPVTPGTFFAVSQAGLIRVVQNGAVREAPFLDLRDEISSGGERGLLGMAFPPDAATSGRLYVNFTNRAGHTVIARFTRDAGDALRVARETRLDLDWGDGRRLIEQPFSNHNGGHLAFGPDGYLYIGLGDGGSGNDPRNLAQSPTSLLGKMLRVDVAVPDDDPRGYSLPPGNPFVGRDDIRPEIWALGYRNPWRYSFDDIGDGATGALIVADVGQGAREEVDYEPAGAGGRNYGWRLREGTIATPGVPPAPVTFGPLVEPVHDYGRGDGQSITGGFVYRGTKLPRSFRGRYFFADFVSGRVWSIGLSIDPESREGARDDLIEHTREFEGSLTGVSSFARDLAGELYVVTIGGTVFRIASDGDEEPEATSEMPLRPRSGGRR